MELLNKMEQEFQDVDISLPVHITKKDSVFEREHQGCGGPAVA